MPAAVDRRLFALDHNFPEPVLAVFGEFLPFVELVPLRSIDPTWTDLDDWELLVALHRHEREWDGLITNDENMLSLAKEMTVLSQTRLTLVVVKGEGHNPIRAVGSLLCHVRHICHHTVRDRAQVWNLRVAQKNHDEVGVYLTKIAERDKSSVADLLSRNRLPPGRLRRDQ